MSSNTFATRGRDKAPEVPRNIKGQATLQQHTRAPMSAPSRRDSGLSDRDSRERPREARGPVLRQNSLNSPNMTSPSSPRQNDGPIENGKVPVLKQPAPKAPSGNNVAPSIPDADLALLLDYLSRRAALHDEFVKADERFNKLQRSSSRSGSADSYSEKHLQKLHVTQANNQAKSAKKQLTDLDKKHASLLSSYIDKHGRPAQVSTDLTDAQMERLRKSAEEIIDSKLEKRKTEIQGIVDIQVAKRKIEIETKMDSKIETKLEASTNNLSKMLVKKMSDLDEVLEGRLNDKIVDSQDSLVNNFQAKMKKMEERMNGMEAAMSQKFAEQEQKLSDREKQLSDQESRLSELGRQLAEWNQTLCDHDKKLTEQQKQLDNQVAAKAQSAVDTQARKAEIDEAVKSKSQELVEYLAQQLQLNMDNFEKRQQENQEMLSQLFDQEGEKRDGLSKEINDVRGRVDDMFGRVTKADRSIVDANTQLNKIKVSIEAANTPKQEAPRPNAQPAGVPAGIIAQLDQLSDVPAKLQQLEGMRIQVSQLETQLRDVRDSRPRFTETPPRSAMTPTSNQAEERQKLEERIETRLHVMTKDIGKMETKVEMLEKASEKASASNSTSFLWNKDAGSITVADGTMTQNELLDMIQKGVTEKGQEYKKRFDRAATVLENYIQDTFAKFDPRLEKMTSDILALQTQSADLTTTSSQAANDVATLRAEAMIRATSHDGRLAASDERLAQLTSTLEDVQHRVASVTNRQDHFDSNAIVKQMAAHINNTLPKGWQVQMNDLNGRVTGVEHAVQYQLGNEPNKRRKVSAVQNGTPQHVHGNA